MKMCRPVSGQIVLAVVAVAALMLVSGCGPKYPNCDNDKHCAEKGEFCVNGMCQQCRDNAHCQEGQQCSAGNCQAIPGYCTSDANCSAGQKCRDNRCGPQCLSNDECGPREKCQGGRCIPAAECYSDDECASGMSCEAGKCIRALVRCSPENVYFDFDNAAIKSTFRSPLEEAARCLQGMAGAQVTIEGHCDERGTQEYNLALGERRAMAVRDYLQRLGVSNIRIISYGEARPADSRRNEEAYSRNRRAEFVIGR